MQEILFPPNPVLMIDDEEHILESWDNALESGGINNTILCQDSREVMGIIKSKDIEVILLDLTMPYITGEELLLEIRNEFSYIPIIIVTGMNDVSTAVGCMKSGVFDYMVKAVEEKRLISGVMRAIENRELQLENSDLKKCILSNDLENPDAFAQIITKDEKMLSVFRYAEAIAKSSQTVLITGETGVGKELIAGALHVLSAREGKYVAVNVAGFDDTMFTDTLFGHTEGAFTDAKQIRKGLVEQSSNGTLFLDEIGDLSPSSQVKLLRLLETREYYPLGLDIAKRSSSRIIVATNRNLEEMVETGQFRRDLYYRLATHEINIPPLRKRINDLPLLIDHFLARAARDLGKKKPSPTPEVYDLLSTYHFPGNIRELESMIFDSLSKHRSGILSSGYFKDIIGRKNDSVQEVKTESSFMFPDRLPSLKEVTELLIDEALKRSKGNQSIAAQLLGISHQALNKRLSRAKN